jgi:phosphoserine phosphatase
MPGSVIVLIAAPGSRAIDDGIVARARACASGNLVWLHEREALEAPSFLDNKPPGPIERALRGEAKIKALEDAMSALQAAIRHRPIDLNIIPESNRRKRLLLADMDSTMIGQECIDELGSLAGVGDRIKDITARAMNGLIDFETALRERVALMKGLSAQAIDRVLRDHITLTAGGKTLIATMKANGAYTVLVSGGFVQFTSHVARKIGFDEHRANELIIEMGMLTGRLKPPILGKDAKRDALVSLSARLGITPQDAIAVGDGANDLPMLQAAGLGVALHAKPHVQEAASVRINHGDLTSLLFLQGISRGEFATSSA